jgi:hypothetical protein
VAIVVIFMVLLVPAFIVAGDKVSKEDYGGALRWFLRVMIYGGIILFGGVLLFFWMICSRGCH